jgi:hypothetical protein
MKAMALALLVGAAACHAPSPRGAELPMPQWLLGDWTGVRRDADGKALPLRYSVAAILGGDAFTETITVQSPPRDYLGFAVVAFDRQQQRWAMLYVNAVRGTFARLESAAVAPWVFRSVAQDRSDDSELTYTRRDDGGLWRTMRVRPVRGGDTAAEWRLLWQDELHRLP